MIATAVLLLSVVAGTNDLGAQALSDDNVQYLHQSAASVNTRTGDHEPINPKAVKNFTRTYKDVTTETWMETRDGFAARFNAEGIRNTILYDVKGHWTGSVKNYTEEKLAANIRHIVKSKYYDYSIFYVDELETNESGGVPTYIIHLEDKNSIKLVRLCDGEMDTWKEYKKG